MPKKCIMFAHFVGWDLRSVGRFYGGCHKNTQLHSDPICRR
ncbi:hypothetical protein SAMN05216271_0752 [Halopseudomonas sabulinigri]|uniref:Uncharacterized protein n=1 Tax=Halopseudomonas sabulinigri TaxID=472181 RepID=A0A1H1N151_9GAMM|nr:hypothetical protein SAMN05216271_0752 [Halopseudomonas sabulinigri]